MIKRDELTNPQSCMNRAKDDEMTFVLLGRDPATPAAIKAWIKERVRLGKNKPDDKQIVEAKAVLRTLGWVPPLDYAIGIGVMAGLLFWAWRTRGKTND